MSGLKTLTNKEQRTQDFLAGMEGWKNDTVIALNNAGWSRQAAIEEVTRMLRAWDSERERIFEKKYREEKYTADYLVHALQNSDFYLNESGGYWYLGSGVRSSGRGIRVPRMAALAAIKHASIVKEEGGGWPYWRARRDDDAAK